MVTKYIAPPTLVGRNRRERTLGMIILSVVGAVGLRRWASISSRKVGAALLAGGLILLIGCGATPPANPTNPVQESTPARPTATPESTSPAATATPELSAADVNTLIAKAGPTSALAVLGAIAVDQALTSTGYDRGAFGALWADTNGNTCDTRNDILARDLTKIQTQPNCIVISGQLVDPYSGTNISFTQESNTSVEIDSVVTPADAWVKGAQTWDAATRLNFANDPFNLLAVGVQRDTVKHQGDAVMQRPGCPQILPSVALMSPVKSPLKRNTPCG